MNALTRLWFFLLLAAGMLFMFSGCGGGSGGDSGADLPVVVTPPDPIADSDSYNGPGSRWDVELNDDDTFVISKRPDVDSAIDLTVEGTYTRSALGFVLLTVVTASGDDAPEEGDIAWAVEAPGYALMLHTDGDRFVPMIEAGNCPEDDMLSNWVIARKRLEADPREPDGDYFGVFAFDASAGVASLPSRHALADGFPDVGSAALEAVSCVAGVAQVSDAVMYLTDNGGALVHSNIDDPDDSSVIFALASKSISSVAALDAEYAGILFDASSADGERISPVTLTCSNGQCSGRFVSDVVNSATAGTLTIDLFGTVNEPSSGFLTGEVRDSTGAAGGLACMADEDVLAGGGKMFSCVGQAPGNNARMINVIFVSN